MSQRETGLCSWTDVEIASGYESGKIMNEQQKADRAQVGADDYSALSKDDLAILRQLFDEQLASSSGVNAKRFRAQNDESLDAISDLVASGWIEDREGKYFVQLVGVAALSRFHPKAESLIYLCSHIYECLRRAYKADPERKLLVSELPELVDMPMGEVRKALPYLQQASLFGSYSTDIDAPDAYVILSEDLIRHRTFDAIVAQHQEWATRRSRDRQAAIQRSVDPGASSQAVKHDVDGLKRPEKKRVKEVRTPLERYTLIKQVGQGGSGFVLAAHNEAGVAVALKYLGSGTSSETLAKRFRNEVRFGLTTRHPNIVPILDVGEADFGNGLTLFYVMPLYVLTLRAAMERRLLTPDASLKVFEQLLAGARAAHKAGVWHRDLKPENILISKDFQEVCIADFGIAHFSENELYSAAETKAADRLANFKYAAPEQRVRDAPKDHRVDIFALGLILNEMITGEIPHGSEYRRIGDVHAPYSSLDDLVSRMIRQQAERRPESIDKVIEEFERLRAATSRSTSASEHLELEEGSHADAANVDPASDFKTWLQQKRQGEEARRRSINAVLTTMREVGPLTPEELARLSPIGIQDLEEMGVIDFNAGRWVFRKMLS